MKKIINVLLIVSLSPALAFCEKNDTVVDLKLDNNMVELKKGGTATVIIETGNGGYKVESDKKEVADASLSGTTITINALSEGDAKITVTDAKDKTATITVKVDYTIPTPPKEEENGEEELVFQSGFEPSSEIVAKGSDSDIIGKDYSLTSHNDWVNDLDNCPDIGDFSIQYQGGDESQRFAKIIPEPGNPANHVLHFWLNEANVTTKNPMRGRIQANLYGGKGMKEFYQSERIFLTDDFNALRTFPNTINWLTIAEFWNNITWRESIPYGFRITLGIGKPVKEESDLYFILDGQDSQRLADGKVKYITLWSDTNNKVKVPIGKWFTLEYYYKEGNAENGRFYMTIQPDGGQKEVIFDLTPRITHNSEDPNPDGVTDFNPIKLYAPKTLIDYMRSQGKTLQIYWDDFKLWKNKRP